MTKNQFTYRYIGALTPLPITRDRAAYILSAARSRGAGNVLRTTEHLYRVLDCGMVVEPR